MSRRRSRHGAPRVGAGQLDPALRRAIAGAVDPLRRSGLGPVATELDWDVVTLVYGDALTERTVAASDLMPDPILVDGRRYRFTTRVAGAVVGGAPFAIARQIKALAQALEAGGAAPAGYRYEPDALTFLFHAPFRRDRARGLLPPSFEVDGRPIYVYAALRDVAVGQTPATPGPAQKRVIDQLIERLVRNDAEPVDYTYEVIDNRRTVTFYYLTPFRLNRAAGLVSGSYAAGARGLLVRHKLLPEALETEVGQVNGTAQATPWTCGPAALRAVLAHHGTDIGEDELAVLAGNVPVLGVRPSGLVKAAQALGHHVSAVVLRDVAALAPFLARDLPVLCVVDSWTQPGRAGHWVVATALEGGDVRIMDPHVAGNWRVVPRPEFDTRWWHREGGRVVRRFAVVVAPEGRVAVGADEPTHGRTARIKGASGGLKAFAKVAQAITKAVVTYFTGGLGGKAFDALLNATGTNVAKMKPNERAAWFNAAGNPEMYAWALAWARDEIARISDPAADPKGKDHAKALDYKAVIDALGLDRTSITDLRAAMVPALKMHLWYYAMRQGKSKWAWLGVHYNNDKPFACALQAILILFYGGLDAAWPVVKAAVKGRPKLDWNDAKAAPAVAGWVDAVVAALAPYRTVAEGADHPDLEFA